MPSKKPKVNSLEYWLQEVEQGMDDERLAFVRIGRALSNLRGQKYKKADHIWRQDGPPIHITTFDQYCKWKWQMDRSRVNQYILAYEVYADINKEGTVVPSSQPESERVLRPLTRLKSEKDRQEAWRLANLYKEKGEKVTAKDTALAVEIVKGTDKAMVHSRVSDSKEKKVAAKANSELKEFSEEGISTVDAFKKIDASWRQLIAGENKKAEIKLATLYKEYLTAKYPNS
jgi:hypothetical protein